MLYVTTEISGVVNLLKYSRRHWSSGGIFVTCMKTLSPSINPTAEYAASRYRKHASAAAGYLQRYAS